MLKPSVSSLGEDECFIKSSDRLQVPNKLQSYQNQEDLTEGPKVWRWSKNNSNKIAS